MAGIISMVGIISVAVQYLIILFSKDKFLGRKDKLTLFTTVMSESEQGFYFICEIFK